MVSEELYSLFTSSDFLIFRTLSPEALISSPENFCNEWNISQLQKKCAASSPVLLRMVTVRVSLSTDWVIDLQITSVRASTMRELELEAMSWARTGRRQKQSQVQSSPYSLVRE